MEKLIPRKQYLIENQILMPAQSRLEIYLISLILPPNQNEKLVQLGNNKKYENEEDSIFTDQKVERREEDIKKKESSKLHDIECVEFLDALNFDNAAVDDDYINYLDQSI